MALAFASYAVPGPWWVQRAVAVACVVALATLNCRGVTRTALLAPMPHRLATATAPLATAVHAADAGTLASFVRVGGAFAALGAALASSRASAAPAWPWAATPT